MTLAPFRNRRSNHAPEGVDGAPSDGSNGGADGPLRRRGGREPRPGSVRRPVLILNNVTKTFPNGRSALREVDLVVPEGDFVFLVGASGAGKSTLIKLLIRDELATEGQVLLDGDDLARLPRRKVPHVRRKVGIIFQDYKLLATKTVRENIAFALEVTGTPRRKIGPAVEARQHPATA